MDWHYCYLLLDLQQLHLHKQKFQMATIQLNQLKVVIMANVKQLRKAPVRNVDIAFRTVAIYIVGNTNNQIDYLLF